MLFTFTLGHKVVQKWNHMQPLALHCRIRTNIPSHYICIPRIFKRYGKKESYEVLLISIDVV